MNYYINSLTQYAKFSGRARRKEYWLFTLFNVLIGAGLGLIEGSFGLFPDSEQSLLANLFVLTVFLPGIAVFVRRMHDVGKSGWFLLIPIYSSILLFIDGDKGPNKYGPDPKIEVVPNLGKYCSRCGAPNKTEANFCASCGAAQNP